MSAEHTLELAAARDELLDTLVEAAAPGVEIIAKRRCDLLLNAALVAVEPRLQRSEQPVAFAAYGVCIEPALRLLERKHADTKRSERVPVAFRSRCVREKLGNDQRILDDEGQLAN